MKLSDFKASEFIDHGEIRLSEWVINGDHYPTVRIYHNNNTNEGYQVSEKYKMYRKTEATTDVHKILEYEKKWKSLEDE